MLTLILKIALFCGIIIVSSVLLAIPYVVGS
jgi:hypothetical protein